DIFRQFSISIVSAMALAVLVAFLLSPARGATMLKTIGIGDRGEGKKRFFGWCNRMFEKSTRRYTESVGGILRSTVRYLVLYQ
ncbi:hydrophobe/amphiphile efflux-1 family RND transporter, partial [Escherichia coli]|uniref:efflux RND transporter permease subunit n=1 Tax=Escherichia coli TaxID=562 RepID=UPI000CA914BE